MVWSTMFIFLSIFGLILLPRLNANDQVCYTENGHKIYYEKTHICCNSVITPRVRDQECCDDNITYYKNTQLCCGGEVVERFVSPNGIGGDSDCSSSDEQCHEQICCGGRIVNKDETVCCQNKPIFLDHSQLKEKDFLECCGQTVLNRKTHFCCNGTRYTKSPKTDCCGVHIYDKNVERCLKNYSPPKRVGLYKDICGDTEYDVRENSCCSGVINNMPEKDPANDMKSNKNRECCDSIVYDTTKSKCCRKIHTEFETHIIPNETNIFCCGDGFFNATHQDCYQGTVLEKVHGKKRCGYTYIDETSEGCCGEKLAYNSTSHDCCNGEKFNVIPRNQHCCNGEGINDNKLCCEDIVPCSKSDANDDSCCYNYKTNVGETYSSRKNQYCVEGEVMTIPADTRPCTRTGYYYPDTEICCGDTVENISSGYDHCCGDKAYKSKLQQCCNNEIHNIPTTEGSCCEVDLKVYRYDDAENPCRMSCGHKTYDYIHEICCEGKVHNLGYSTECCGSSTIESDSTKCCGGRFPYFKNGNNKCCGDRELFDSRNFKCRHEKIVPRDLALRKHSGVKRLCNQKALNYFEGGIKYACESLYAVRARLSRVQISRKQDPKIIYIKMLLTEVRSLNRGENFTQFSGQKTLNFTAEIPNDDGIKCQKRYFDRYCEVIIFFNARVKNGNVTINKHSKFFMARYTKQRERIITKQLSYQFCVDKFSVNNKQ